ncbi:MAG: chloride channel protein [Candidatus Odinarchaeota archaeon]
MLNKDIGMVKGRDQEFSKYLKRWLPVATVIGIASGATMCLFMAIIRILSQFFSFLPLYIAMLAGGLITTLAIYLGYEEVRGAGISYYIEKKNKEEEVPAKVAAIKLATSATTIGSGCSAGKEGPAVVVGAAIGYHCGFHIIQRLTKEKHVHKKDLASSTIIGTAAATAAIFQAPLGGTIFAAEIPYKQDIDLTVYMPAFFAAIIAYLTYNSLFFMIFNESPTLLSFLKVNLDLTFPVIIAVIILGCVCGIVGTAFSVFFSAYRDFWERKLAWTAKRPHLIPIIGIIQASIITLLFILFLDDENLTLGGTGFELLNDLEVRIQTISIVTLFLLLAGKLIITSFTVGSGVSGGIFGPSLVIGATTGALFGQIIGYHEYIGAFFILGMSAMLASTTKALIASVVFILEMVSLPPLIIPMGIASLAAFIVSGNQSLYTGQLRSREEKIKKEIAGMDLLQRITVKEIMSKDVLFIPQVLSISAAKKALYNIKKHTVPILDDGKLVGIVTIDDINQALHDEKENNSVADLMIKDVITIDQSATIGEALYKMLDYDVERFPVLDHSANNKLVGFLTLHDIMKAHRDLKFKTEKD